MNGGTANSEQQELIGELRRRFPLIERLVGCFGHDTQEERIPWFIAILLAAATKRDPGACCFVLDKTKGTAAVVAILLALVRLQQEFHGLVSNYVQTALSPGQRVRVKPNNYVYEYDGVWEEYPHLFKLKELGEESNKRSFPIEDVLRLEPTDRVRPEGRGNSDLGVFKRSQLDELLGLTTGGNNSLIRNSVLLYTPQARFAEVLDAIVLAPEHANGLASLSGFFPWGSIGPQGELKPNDAYQVAGEPIIAVTRVPEDLALASSSATVATKVVVVDGARGLTRDLQAFDDIADRQRVVILASSEETDALDLLRDRECPIWHVSPDEILIGETSSTNRARTSFVGATIRAAVTRRRVRVRVVDCQDTVLQSVAATLERAAEQIRDSEEAHESEEILVRLFGILFECSECCFGVGEETKANLRAAREQLTRHGKWLDPEVDSELQQASFRLENVIKSGIYGQGKADVLLDFLLDQKHEPWVVVARSPRTAESLRKGFDDLGVTSSVIPVSAITPDRDYAGVIVPAWPNDKKFTRLKGQAVTPDIRVLTYPFETKWVSRHQAREHARECSDRVETKTRSAILGIEPRLLIPMTPHQPEPTFNEGGLDQPIFRIEDRVARRRRVARPMVAADGEESREAQLVQFFGNCHALLTEWAELPRLNQLIDGTNTNDAKLTTVAVSKLAPGDFVLFRASGDKEFIRLIAEDILGAEEYERVRTLAERWRSPLQRLGTSRTDVQRRLASHGLNRTSATIGGWLGPDRIGPGDFHDIEFIAKAAGDAELLSIRKEVEEAISRIRGTHISAGSQLTQLLLGELGGRLNQLDEQPVLLDLDFGEAWVVQVEMIEESRQEYPSNLVNKLLWTDEVAF